ncbi:hypothetical protein BH11CYA1_BH11CYA1_40200 [soil metagenome]
MWPNGKGKGGKGESSESGDGDEPKPRKKPRATRTKLKAMTAEAAKALQNTGDLPSAQPPLSPEELLEAEIFRAADQASADQLAREEAARASGPEFLKISENSVSLDDQLSGVWKARLMGGTKPAPQNASIPSAANRGAMEAVERARTNAQHESMIGIVDRMFDQFQNLAYDFNQVASASDLELTWIRPSINRENIGSWHQGSQYLSVFNGRISTRYWTLVVRGSSEYITSHIIPADKLLTFNAAPANYMPMFEMVPYFDGAMVYWSAGQKQLKTEDIQQAARAVLDSLVQVAQEDMPPTKPIDMFAPAVLPADAPIQKSAPAEPTVSMLGGDIDYSERYRQHFSGDSSANVGAPPNPFSAPYPNSTNTSVNNTSVNNNSVNNFRQFAPNQPNNQASSQGGPAASADDWKPVVRNVRGAAGPQPLQPRQFQNPTADPSSNSPSSPQSAPMSSPPSFAAPAPPFAAPASRPPSQADDGWRGVDSTSPVQPANAPAPSFKPAFPTKPASSPSSNSNSSANSDSLAGGSQSMSGQRPTVGSGVPGAPSSDDWNFVPIEKLPKELAQSDTGPLAPVNFPANLFADMPPSLGFPSGAAPSPGFTPAPAPSPNPSTNTNANAGFSPTSSSASNASLGGQTSGEGLNPFARPFGASNAAAKSQPPASSPSPASLDSAAPPAVPMQQPSNLPLDDDENDANPFYTPLAVSTPNLSQPPAQPPASHPVPPPVQAPNAPMPSPLPPVMPDQVAQGQASVDTASGASPWGQAPAPSQGGNKADFNPTASSTETHMIAPPWAPMPVKESTSNFFEPAVEIDETKTVEIATTGQFSADRFAFDIANQTLPAADLNRDVEQLDDSMTEPVVEHMIEQIAAHMAEQTIQLEEEARVIEAPAQEEEAPEVEALAQEEEAPEVEALTQEEQTSEVDAFSTEKENEAKTNQADDGLSSGSDLGNTEDSSTEDSSTEDSDIEDSDIEESDIEESDIEDLSPDSIDSTADELEVIDESKQEHEAEDEQEQANRKEESDQVADELADELAEDELAEDELADELAEDELTEGEHVEDELEESAVSAINLDADLRDRAIEVEQDNEVDEVQVDQEGEDKPESSFDDGDEDDSDEDAEDENNKEIEDEAKSDLDPELSLELDSEMQLARDDDHDRLTEIEEETVESIAELEEELAQSTDDLSQSMNPWCGPADSDQPNSAEESQSHQASGFEHDQGEMLTLPAFPSFSPISASLGGAAPLIVASSEHSLKSEIDRVIFAFDKELELISTKGSDAFARRDLKGAEHMIKLAEMISEYKEGLAKLKNEYDKDLT